MKARDWLQAFGEAAVLIFTVAAFCAFIVTLGAFN